MSCPPHEYQHEPYHNPTAPLQYLLPIHTDHGYVTSEYPSPQTPQDIGGYYNLPQACQEEVYPQYLPPYPAHEEYVHNHHHIHAPIPVSSYSTLLPHLARDISRPPTAQRPQEFPSYRYPPVPQMSSPSSPTSSSCQSLSPPPPSSHASYTPKLEQELPEEMRQVNPLELYGSAPQVMFPTPCELLADLTDRNGAASQAASRSTSRIASLSPVSPSRSTVRKAKNSPKAAPARGGKVRSSASIAAAAGVPHKTKNASAKAAAAQEQADKAKPENLRKSYFRRVAEYVGFKPTDP